MTVSNQDSPSTRIRIWAAGQALGRYELLLPIARGGMAQVWAARLRESRAQTLVAIKTILPDLDQTERLERMLLDEASFAARIRHPNVIKTIELGEDQGVLYLVMEWFDGEPLNVAAQLAGARGGMPLEHACNLIAQVCRGLHAAHELKDESGASLGLVHRDVSPQNILVNHRGLAKLVDFGIAKATNRDSTTEHGEVKGKYTYMSPEQICGESVDRRADIFALGVVLYSLTTNYHPFRGKNVAQTIRRICSSTPAVPPSTAIKDFPVGLEAVLARALAKDPAERYPTALAFSQAIEAALPSAFDGGSQARLEQYLSTLLEEKLKQRVEVIRKALRERDPGRVTGEADAASVGSLKAICVDAAAAAPGRDGEPADRRVSLKARPGRTRLRHRASVVAASAMLATVAVTAPVWRGTGEKQRPPVGAAAPQPALEQPIAPPLEPASLPSSAADAGPHADALGDGGVQSSERAAVPADRR